MSFFIQHMYVQVQANEKKGTANIICSGNAVRDEKRNMKSQCKSIILHLFIFFLILKIVYVCGNLYTLVHVISGCYCKAKLQKKKAIEFFLK